MSKFKIGDEVRIVRLEYNQYPWNRHLNETGTVTAMGEESDGTIFWDVRFSKEACHGFYESELELEAVYNSPLYKALS